MPTRLSTFVGRKKELAELRRLLPHTRLLTLLGPGGVGKTRLAAEFVGRQGERHQQGALFAELGDVSDGARVVEAIARAASARLEGTDQFAALVRRLHDQPLLVVDNCEHLVAAAADVVTRLLRECPHLTVVATSRERLNVEGETAWTVPPLTVPSDGVDIAAADASDAVGLFVDRARSVRPGFILDGASAAAVLTICRRLDGIPLAIELAAARMTTLSAQEIVPRLEHTLRLLTGGTRDSASRQQTLRATIDWSYELLDLTEQRLLQRMSVFAGSADASAVQDVCAFPPLDQGDVLDALVRLVEKSMVQVEDGGERMRYRLLETIREYAQEQVVAAGREHDLRDRHLARYRRLVRDAFDARRHRGALAEHRQLWREMPDVRAALEWAASDPEIEQEMLGGLYLVWLTNAPVEGYERLTRSLDRTEPRPSAGYLRAGHTWSAVGGITKLRQNRMLPEHRLLALGMAHGDRYLVASVEMGMGYECERILGDFESAHQHMVTGVGIFIELGPGPLLAMAMGSLGSMEVRLGRPDVGRDWIEKAVAMTLAVDDPYGAIGAYFHLGQLELDHGSRADALKAFLAGLELVEYGDTISITDQVAGIACALASEDPGFALRLFSAAASLRSKVAPELGMPWGPRVQAGVAEAEAALPQGTAATPWAGGEGLTADALLAEVRARFGGPAGAGPARASGLSRRELEIAELVASGMTSRAIAQKLFLSDRTVETHLTHVMTKLDFNSRAQVAAWVTEQRAR